MRNVGKRVARMIVTMAVVMAGCANESPCDSVADDTIAPLTTQRLGASAAIRYVPEAIPTQITIPAIRLSASVRVLSASTCPVLNPPTLEDAYCVECRAKPGSYSDGTVVIIGHSVAHGHGVFNDLPRVSIGDEIVVRTPAGELTYRVRRTVKYDKNGEVQRAPDMLARVPGRLLAVTCYLDADGRSTNENFVAQADLVEAFPAYTPTEGVR